MDVKTEFLNVREADGLGRVFLRFAGYRCGAVIARQRLVR
jgi:hypothetical protein